MKRTDPLARIGPLTGAGIGVPVDSRSLSRPAASPSLCHGTARSPDENSAYDIVTRGRVQGTRPPQNRDHHALTRNIRAKPGRRLRATSLRPRHGTPKRHSFAPTMTSGTSAAAVAGSRLYRAVNVPATSQEIAGPAARRASGRAIESHLIRRPARRCRR
jgi:hypothetical protein